MYQTLMESVLIFSIEGYSVVEVSVHVARAFECFNRFFI